ncbi:MAG: hypothetical protein WCI40_03415 [Verrucomicrobiota bacterium]
MLLLTEQSELFPISSPLPSPDQMVAYRAADQAKRDQWEVHQIGTVAHLRAQQTAHDAAQHAAADTCVVELYLDGMGLRVERRKPGFSWAGSGKKPLEVVGQGDDRVLVKNTGSGKRGKCKGATTSSMSRFRDLVYKVSRFCLPVMLTLGWPKAQTPDPDECKRCLHAFIEALCRKHPRAAGFWKLEFGELSGLPHYHLLLWGAKPWHKWVARTWYRICATGNPEHRTAGTRVEALRSYRGTLAYCGKKYVTKTSIAPPGDWGRVWGCFRRKLIPWAECIRVEAPWRVGMWYARIMRRYMIPSTQLDW